MPSKIREGWGITTVGDELVISDGTDQLYFVQPDWLKKEIKINKVLTVVDEKGIFDKEYLNLADLEYVDGRIYANIWYTHSIVVIDPDTGKVISDVDLSLLIKFENLIKNSNVKLNVLNGIAYDSLSKR